MKTALKQIKMYWLFLIIVTFCGVPAHAKRVALSIGNDTYQSVTKLAKAGNDAEAMSEEFKKAGFEVDLKKNLNYKNMIKAVDAFLGKIKKGDEVAIFYAGHGVQLKTGAYLLPTDIEAESESEIEKFAYGLYELTEKINEKKASFALLIIDACRDNPFGSRTRSIGTTRGLSAIEPAKGQMVVYSASRGQQALDSLSDSDRNPNGVFTREFISKMKQPGLRIEDVLRQVQDSVETLATKIGHEQRPALYNESRGNFYFYAPIEAVTPPPVTLSAPETTIEELFWNDAKTTGNKEAFEAYLNTYPSGKFVNLAKANIAKLVGKSTIDNSTKARNAIFEEMALWNDAKKNNDKKTYENYFIKYPNGFFSGLAKEAINIIEQENFVAELQKSKEFKDQEKLAAASKYIKESKDKMKKEEGASIELVKALLRIEVPTF